jgi:HK97 family phage portal protein
MPGFWSRLFGRHERRLSVPAEVAFNVVPGDRAGGVEALGAVSACVSLISSAFASLSPSLEMADGSPAPPGLSAWRLLQRPSEYHSWPSWTRWCAASELLTGNALLQIITDGRGGVSGLTPIPWDWISPQIVGTGDATRLVFNVMNGGPEAQLLRLPRRLLAEETLHLKSRGDTVIGRSVLSRAAGPINEAMAIQALAEHNWRNGARPSLALTAPTYLSEQQRARKQEFIDAISGVFNTGKVAVLEGGWKVDQLSLNSVDSEFLSTRRFSTAEIARLFGVPAIMLEMNDRMPNDLAAVTAMFAQQAVLPLVTTFEAEFSNAILPDGVYLRLDMDAMMRGSFSAVTAAICAATQSGLLTINDGRSALGWPPIADGDRLRPGNAPSYPGDFVGSTAMHPSPGPADGQPRMPSHGDQGRKGNGHAPGGPPP